MSTVSMSLDNQGINYRIKYKLHTVSFPLPSNASWVHNLRRSGFRDCVYELEQLWLQDNLLTSHSGNIILPYVSVAALTDEACKSLGIVCNELGIALSEESFFGSNCYSISWKAIRNGVPVPHCKRFGSVITDGEHFYRLTEEQFKLVERVDDHPAADVVSQAKYQTEVRNLAYACGADMTRKLQDSHDVYVENAGFNVSSVDDHTLTITPEITIPDGKETSITGGTLRNTQLVSGLRGQLRIICDPSTVQAYNTTARTLHGADVPAFLHNPLRFLPEDISFEPELFSARVKGLKILVSQAVPYMNLEPVNGKIDWFSFDTGILIRDENGNETKIKDEDAEELILDDGNYVYRNGQWIYIDKDVIRKYIEAAKRARTFIGNEPVPRHQARKVLEIFDNIDSLEYNENVLDIKKELLSMQNKDYVRPSGLNAELYSYQQDGYVWLQSLRKMNIGGLLADDMGLGKTLQAIAFMAYLFEQNPDARILIVMPSALLENWQNEIYRFLPNIRHGLVYLHRGPGRCRTTEQIELYSVVLTTYETLSRDQIFMGKVRWDLMICDETQKIKNFQTMVANASKGMKADQRLALTGTPVENRLGELWSIVDFVQPGLLNNYQWFRKNFEVPIRDKGCDDCEEAEELKRIIRPIFLRRTKEDELNLMPKTEHVVSCPMSPAELSKYKEIIDRVDSGEIKALAGLTKLIEVCSHPYLLEYDEELASSKQLMKASGKLNSTVQLLKEIRDRGEKAVIFTRFRTMQQILCLTIYEQFGIEASVINGEISESRVEIIRRFSDVNGFNIMILSPKAAGVGLNIVAANNVIHYTREWNPAIENQATDRVYRIGQTRPVNVYYPTAVCAGAETIDQKISVLLNDKKRLMRSIIVPANLEITEADLTGIFNSKT